MIFVDTSAWFAFFLPIDPNHDRVHAWSAANVKPLVRMSPGGQGLAAGRLHVRSHQFCRL